MKKCHGNEINIKQYTNIGIMVRYSKLEKMSTSQFLVFLEISALSIGRGAKCTEQITVAELADRLCLSSPTVTKAIKELVDAGHIIKIKENSFGSTPYSYCPALPTFAEVYLNEIHTKKETKKDVWAWFKNLIK